MTILLHYSCFKRRHCRFKWSAEGRSQLIQIWSFFFQTVWSPFRSVMRLLHREYCLTMWNVSLVFCQMGHLSSPSWPPPCEQTSSSVRAYRKRLRLRPYCRFSSFKYAPTELPALILWSVPPPVLWNHCNLFLMPFVCHCESVRYNSHGPYKWAMFTCNLMQVLNTCIIHLWKILLPVTPQKMGFQFLCLLGITFLSRYLCKFCCVNFCVAVGW